MFSYLTPVVAHYINRYESVNSRWPFDPVAAKLVPYTVGYKTMPPEGVMREIPFVSAPLFINEENNNWSRTGLSATGIPLSPPASELLVAVFAGILKTTDFPIRTKFAMTVGEVVQPVSVATKVPSK